MSGSGSDDRHVDREMRRAQVAHQHAHEKSVNAQALSWLWNETDPIKQSQMSQWLLARGVELSSHLSKETWEQYCQLHPEKLPMFRAYASLVRFRIPHPRAGDPPIMVRAVRYDKEKQTWSYQLDNDDWLEEAMLKPFREGELTWDDDGNLVWSKGFATETNEHWGEYQHGEAVNEGQKVRQQLQMTPVEQRQGGQSHNKPAHQHSHLGNMDWASP